MTSGAAILKKYGIVPKRSLGQHFMVAVPTIEKIVRTLSLQSSDKVLEIGSGIGIMTAMIAQKAKFVAAIEADRRMVEILESELEACDNLQVIQGDFLSAKLKSVCTGAEKWKCAGNIPYNISTPILYHIIDHSELFSNVVLVMQREVALKLTARPRTKEYGITSVLCQAYCDIEYVQDISASSFLPPPNVVSALIRMSMRDISKNAPSKQLFIKLVKSAFNMRRKTIYNALMSSSLFPLHPEEVMKLIESSGVEATSRPEEISWMQYWKMAKAVNR